MVRGKVDNARKKGEDDGSTTPMTEEGLLPFHLILEKIKHEPYFRWSSKMSSDASQRKQSLHYSYHREWGHTTEDYRFLQNHLSHLAKIGHLKKFLTSYQALDSNLQGFE